MSEKNLNQPTEHKTGTANKEWQQSVLEKLAGSALREQVTARRWNIFFKALIFIYLFVVLF
jgi:protease IV